MDGTPNRSDKTPFSSFSGGLWKRGGGERGVPVLHIECRIKISRMSPNRIFLFLIFINPPSGNVKIQKLIAKHIFKCFEKRKGKDGKK